MQFILIGLLLSLNLNCLFVQSFRGALIVSNPMGFSDVLDLDKILITQYSLDGFNDFTVASSDTIRSYLGFVTGKLQLDVNIDLLSTINVSDKNS